MLAESGVALRHGRLLDINCGLTGQPAARPKKELGGPVAYRQAAGPLFAAAQAGPKPSDRPTVILFVLGGVSLAGEAGRDSYAFSLVAGAAGPA